MPPAIEPRKCRDSAREPKQSFIVLHSKCSYRGSRAACLTAIMKIWSAKLRVRFYTPRRKRTSGHNNHARQTLHLLYINCRAIHSARYIARCVFCQKCWSLLDRPATRASSFCRIVYTSAPWLRWGGRQCIREKDGTRLMVCIY